MEYDFCSIQITDATCQSVSETILRNNWIRYIYILPKIRCFFRLYCPDRCSYYYGSIRLHSNKKFFFVKKEVNSNKTSSYAMSFFVWMILHPLFLSSSTEGNNTPHYRGVLLPEDRGPRVQLLWFEYILQRFIITMVIFLGPGSWPGMTKLGGCAQNVILFKSSPKILLPQ